ncbi:hypothetical protein GQ44DRAFT_728412 [Phaeosphaeriaceae sp. PMI808]|nr:hypothetical protein GQ44DRAFT_728412 [Phaeosphaeriaceae sp. PMI808]
MAETLALVVLNSAISEPRMTHIPHGLLHKRHYPRKSVTSLALYLKDDSQEYVLGIGGVRKDIASLSWYAKDTWLARYDPGYQKNVRDLQNSNHSDKQDKNLDEVLCLSVQRQLAIDS